MRLALLTTAAACTASAVRAAPTPTQWIVIGTNGELVDVDPQPYTPQARRERKAIQQQEEAEEAQRLTAIQLSKWSEVTKPHVDDGFFDDDDEEQVDVQVNATDMEDLAADPLVPDIETLLLASDNAPSDGWNDDSHERFEELDEFQGHDHGETTIVPSISKVGPAPSFLVNLLIALEDDSKFPAVQGSVVFAELSCLFVAFIAYLVRSVPLWPSFSTGQKCCLLIAFSAAFLYQFIAFGWYFDVISADVTLGISSLITRTISLGMVPITTTSFVGRTRLAAEQALSDEKPERPKPSKPSRHRKARSS